MSIRHMSLVMDHFVGPAHLKLTLLLIADHADDNGECYPSYETLAARMCCSERTVIRNVKQLVDAGYIEYVMHGGRVYDRATERYINASNTFRVIEDALKALPNLRDDAKKRRKNKQKLSTGTYGRGDTDVTPGGDTYDTPLKPNRGDTYDTLTINRTIINNHHKKKSVEKGVSALSAQWAMGNG